MAEHTLGDGRHRRGGDGYIRFGQRRVRCTEAGRRLSRVKSYPSPLLSFLLPCPLKARRKCVFACNIDVTALHSSLVQATALTAKEKVRLSFISAFTVACSALYLSPRAMLPSKPATLQQALAITPLPSLWIQMIPPFRSIVQRLTSS